MRARVHDQFIMEAAMERNMSNPDLSILNNWRMYYKVSRLSDICNAEGNKIQKRYLICPSNDEDQFNGTTNLRWPYQQRPHKKYFYICKKSDHTMF
jgi:hypothetical protein